MSTAGRPPDARRDSTGSIVRHGTLEVPQLVGDRIVFCAMKPSPGTYYLVGEPLGPYAYGGVLSREHYAGRYVEHGGERHLLGWSLRDFELSDPL